MTLHRVTLKYKNIGNWQELSGRKIYLFSLVQGFESICLWSRKNHTAFTNHLDIEVKNKEP
jgi:hypothetical protein